MASTNHDSNHVKFSRKINDPVSAATTDGSEVTSALRNTYLNQANKYIQLTILGLSGGDWSRRRDLVARYIPGLIQTQAITWASGGTTVGTTNPDGYTEWLEVVDSSAGIMRFHPSKMELDEDVNPNVQSAFTILGGKIYGYAAGSQLTSGATGTLYYVKSDIMDTANNTNGDISIDAKWYDTLVDLAVSFYLEEKGEDASVFLRRYELMLAAMRGM